MLHKLVALREAGLIRSKLTRLFSKELTDVALSSINHAKHLPVRGHKLERQRLELIEAEGVRHEMQYLVK